MIAYFVKYYDKLGLALWEHLQLVFVSLTISLVLAAILTVLCAHSRIFAKIIVNLLAVIYAIPSLAMFALLIPFTGLGWNTAVLVLIVYNQYLLLRNFLGGLAAVDKDIVDAATGMGMSNGQLLLKIKLPLAKKAVFAGIRIAAVSTIGIATIAAAINAGGLGTILFDGLRTVNVYKIVWGSLLAAGLAIVTNHLLGRLEHRLK